MKFDEFFKKATINCEPYPYQRRFATAERIPALLSAPTGIGKTATVVLGWLWRRRLAADEVRQTTPRRLVFCLPMRTLVEQTRDECDKWRNNLGLDGNEVGVHLLMGGEDADDWGQNPERDTIIIGTQDMLLSRALNRGYGMNRYRWPMHFGLLNNDCLWAMDETQLMGCGLFTSAQLDLFGHIWPREKRCHFLWMSATIGDSFDQTADRKERNVTLGERESLQDDDFDDPRLHERLNAEKAVEVSNKAPTAKRILEDHQEGRITLAILNTVPSARTLFEELREQVDNVERFKDDDARPAMYLLHGRYRPNDRRRYLDQINDFIKRIDSESGAVAGDAGLIIVSTQVIEAGFDLSSVRLWSEIAPWASIVQRLGRLNRAGKQPDACATFWNPKGDKDRENHKDSPNAKRIGPYEKEQIQLAKKLIEQLIKETEAGKPYREALKVVSSLTEAQQALEAKPDAVIRPIDFLELFATEPDLAGGFTDVSHYVRSSDRNSDVQVFWREFGDKNQPAADEGRPQRNEICNVPVYEVQKFVDKQSAFEWNTESRSWEQRRRNKIHPGMTILLDHSTGGYSDELGWTGSAWDKPTIVSSSTDEPESIESDLDSLGPDWVSLPDHLADVEAEAHELVDALDLKGQKAKSTTTAARWHDWGKSLDRWQCAVAKTTATNRAKMNRVLKASELSRFHGIVGEWLPQFDPPHSGETLWAKFPDLRDFVRASPLPSDDQKFLARELYAPFRPDHRHEAASALAAWEAWQSGNDELSALAVYLMACHHGKVRTVMRRTRNRRESESFGLLETDVLRPVAGISEHEHELQFGCCRFGATGTWDESCSTFELESPSWLQMVSELIGSEVDRENESFEVIPDDEPRGLGPFVLGYLEAVVCVADIRASKKPGKGATSQ